MSKVDPKMRLDDAVSRSKMEALVRQRFGIELSKSKAKRLEAFLEDTLQKRQVNSMDELFSELSSGKDSAFLGDLATVVTTNVTKFFREVHHFDALGSEIVPSLKEKSRLGKPVRIWSAGCSTGQEPYSIGLMLDRMWPGFHEKDVKILATDIDRQALHVAESGFFDGELVSEIPEQYRDQFVKADGGMSIKDDIRKSTYFRYLNLMEDFPFRNQFDVIFCRNVAIYFSDEIQELVWKKLVRYLTPGGYLFVGHSERIAESQKLGLTPFGTTGYVLSAPVGH